MAEAWSDRLDFTLATPRHEIHDIIARFTWGDYTCLSYTWGQGEGHATTQECSIFLDGIAVTVTKHLEVALKDLRSSYECQLGLKLWVDALCIDQADIADRNAHVLRIKDIFGGAFSVTIWTKTDDDLILTGLDSDRPGERLGLCEVVFKLYGQQVLEELLGVRKRDWGAADGDEDEELRMLVEDVEELVFDDDYYWADSDDSDELALGPGLGGQHLRDVVQVELLFMLRKEYWSRLWTIQELAVSPTTSMVYWGESKFHLSALQAVGGIVLAHSTPGSFGAWDVLKLGLDRLAFANAWRALETISISGSTEFSLDAASTRELNLLAGHARCSLPQDNVYGVLGMFSSSVSGAVTVDYNREAVEVIAEFCSVVPGWSCN